MSLWEDVCSQHGCGYMCIYQLDTWAVSKHTCSSRWGTSCTQTLYRRPGKTWIHISRGAFLLDWLSNQTARELHVGMRSRKWLRDLNQLGLVPGLRIRGNLGVGQPLPSVRRLCPLLTVAQCQAVIWKEEVEKEISSCCWNWGFGTPVPSAIQTLRLPMRCTFL